jgi:hypothetical protein
MLIPSVYPCARNLFSPYRLYTDSIQTIQRNTYLNIDIKVGNGF